MAIHYSSVRRPPKPGQIYGLQVAILDWLRAWLRYGQAERLNFLVADEASQREILDLAEETGVPQNRLAILDARFPRENFGSLETIFRADPDSCDLLWQRAYTGASFSFCGLAHAISGRETAQVLEAYALAPSGAGDAIICPSRAVATAIRRYWDYLAAFGRERGGGWRDCSVQLPVLPLGVDTARIAAKVTPEKRAAQRAALGIGPDDIVLLWVGRLSYAIKAHPLPMFRAAELAAQRTGRKVHLVMQGYFVPEDSSAEFAALARAVCTQAQVLFVPADDPRFPDGLWAAGDVFLSLVDNMQESFGLTPVEAIAAGLPRVVSDWDGYRDAVTHGEDGFLVPTLQPPAGAGGDLAATLLGGRETYGGFLALTAQCVAVDHEAAAQALFALIENPDLRARMAAKARERLPDYDWARILPAYESLARDLRAQKNIGAVQAGSCGGARIHPHAPDPFAMYEAYASAVLTPDTGLALGDGATEIGKLLTHKMNRLAADFLFSGNEMGQLLQAVQSGRITRAGGVLALFADRDPAILWRSIGWMLKMGFLRQRNG